MRSVDELKVSGEGGKVGAADMLVRLLGFGLEDVVLN